MDWAFQFPGAVTVCDRDLTILYMNEKAAENFSTWGGSALLGTSLVNCHKPESVTIMQKILADGVPNVYTITKGKKRKLIYQAPWKREGVIAGVVEISLELPESMPHHDRDAEAALRVAAAAFGL
jgi:predicted RNA methylase